MSKLNENILYNSLSFLPFDLLVDGLIDIGYENDINVLGNDKSGVQSKWVDECRQIGIETFVQRISAQDTTETCSLLSLSSVNQSDDEIAMIQASRNALEEHMKKDSLDNFFYSLTPHILYQYCQSLMISLPPPTTTSNNSKSPSSNNSSDDEQDQLKQQIVSKIDEKDETKTIVNSQPLIQVENDGTTIISTVSTKSFYQKYTNGRGLQYGDSIIEGQFYESIIGLLKDEILLSGTENLFSLFNIKLLQSISKVYKIDNNINSTSIHKDIIPKIIVLLFNLKQFNNSPDINNNDNSNKNNNKIQNNKVEQEEVEEEEEEEEEEDDESSSSLVDKQENEENLNNYSSISLKRKIMDYPSSPSDFDHSNDEMSDSDSRIIVEETDLESEGEGEQQEEEEIKRSKKKSKTEQEEEEEEEEENHQDEKEEDLPYFEEIEDDDQQPTQIAKYDNREVIHVSESENDQEQEQQQEKKETIFKGMDRKDLESMLNIELLEWLENNGIKTEKRQSKDKLIDKVISVLNNK